MKKLLSIDRCYGHCYFLGTYDYRRHHCNHPNTSRKTTISRKTIRTNIYKEIPDWCPLEDDPHNPHTAPVCLSGAQGEDIEGGDAL